jgi:hypothetical protein
MKRTSLRLYEVTFVSERTRPFDDGARVWAFNAGHARAVLARTLHEYLDYSWRDAFVSLRVKSLRETRDLSAAPEVRP